MQTPSKILDNAVEQLSSLPGIGKRSALRLALNLLQRNEQEIHDFANSSGCVVGQKLINSSGPEAMVGVGQYRFK